MKIAVTGASGHVGANLVDALLNAGHHVRAICRRPNTAPLVSLSIERITADITDYSAIESAINKCDIVFHLAAKISIDGDRDGSVHKTNVIGTQNVAKAALVNQVKRLIHVSSIHAFEPTSLDQSLNEKRALALHKRYPAYDRSKANGVLELQPFIQQGLNTVIIHPTGIIGPKDFSPSRMGKVFLSLHQQKLLSLVQGGFNWVDVRDVVNVLIAAINLGRSGERYLVGGHYHSIKDLANIVAKVAAIKAPRFVCPMWLAQFGAPFSTIFNRLLHREPLYTLESLHALRGNVRVDDSKARSELGHQPRSTEETIRDLYHCFTRRGILQ